MSKQAHYPADHPVTIALAGMAVALRTGRDLLDALAERASGAGVEPWSAAFDEAAALAGYHYSRAWDAYLDRATWAEAERPPAPVH